MGSGGLNLGFQICMARDLYTEPLYSHSIFSYLEIWFTSIWYYYVILLNFLNKQNKPTVPTFLLIIYVCVHVLTGVYWEDVHVPVCRCSCICM